MRRSAGNICRSSRAIDSLLNFVPEKSPPIGGFFWSRRADSLSFRAAFGAVPLPGGRQDLHPCGARLGDVLSPNAPGQGHGPKRPIEGRVGVGESALIRRCRDTFSQREKDGMHFAAAMNRQQRPLSFSPWEKVARQGRMRVLFLPQTRLIYRAVGGRPVSGQSATWMSPISPQGWVHGVSRNGPAPGRRT